MGLHHLLRLAVIPLSIKLLGLEQYGLWLVVGAATMWARSTDLGLAPGMVNLVAGAQGRGDEISMRRVISTGVMAYGVMSLTALLLTFAVVRWPMTSSLLGVGDAVASGVVEQLVLVCGLSFSLSLLTRIAATVCQALQEGHLGEFAEIGGAILSVAILLGLVWTGGGLVAYAVGMTFSSIFAHAILGYYVFWIKCPQLRPRWGDGDRETFRSFCTLAIPMSVQQFANSAVLFSANLLIGNRLGAGEVAHYSVPYAIFALVMSVSWLFARPYLAAIAEAKERADWDWIRQTALRMLGQHAVIAGGVSLVLVAGGRLGLGLLTGGAIEPAVGLLGALAVYTVVRVVTTTANTIVMGASRVSFAAVAYSSTAVLQVAVAWLLLPVWGIVTIPIAGGVSHGLYLLMLGGHFSVQRWVGGTK
ncbi:MAG: hypothetical protein M9913_05900 [Bryobacteraceae bacterium]|nr:oligosaccharide flippase family protein [Solibacteraceae bacterium]MCO5350424.1 hypothetical protein [Bryobacteraceae bacterium]